MVSLPLRWRALLPGAAGRAGQGCNNIDTISARRLNPSVWGSFWHAQSCNARFVSRAGTRCCTVVSRCFTVKRHEKNWCSRCWWRPAGYAISSPAGTRRRFSAPGRRWLSSRSWRPTKGKPVTDLKQEDISILQNGKPQPVAFFRFEGVGVRAGRRRSRHTNRSRRAFSPTVPNTRPGRRATSPRSCIDSLNTLPEDQVAVQGAGDAVPARARAEHARRDLPLGSTLRIVHDFTADLKALRARLAKHNDRVQHSAGSGRRARAAPGAGSRALNSRRTG